MNSLGIISKTFYHEDIRSFGSGNAGMTNMMRNYGRGAAAATLVGDMLKTAISVGIGALLAAYPHLVWLIREISVMGGSYFEDAVAFIPAEWNIRNDPLAAKIVFDSGIPVRIFGLDVTLKLKIRCTDFISAPHPDCMKPVVALFLEVTRGARFFSAAKVALPLSIPLSAFTLGFGGISVLMQSMALTSDLDISFSPYVFLKLTQGIFAFFISYCICIFIY